MKCQYCKTDCVKNGKQKSGVQKFQCKCCKKYQQENYVYQARIKFKKDLIVSLIIHNCGFRAVSEVLNLSVNTVRETVLKEAENCFPPKVSSGGVYEVDEMCAYKKVGEKEIWACYAIEKKSKKIVGINVGRRKKSMIRKTVDAVLQNHPKKIYTDGFSSYKKLIPKHIHKRFSFLLSHIERVHMNARNYLKMLNRKTLAFVRSEVMLLACLKLLFWNTP